MGFPRSCRPVRGVFHRRMNQLSGETGVTEAAIGRLVEAFQAKARLGSRWLALWGETAAEIFEPKTADAIDARA